MKTDEQKAAFMRDVGAVEATWGFDPSGTETLLSLKLGPPTKARVEGNASPPAAASPNDLAARLRRFHETQFAHSRVRPPLPDVTGSESVVPRAVNARQAPNAEQSPPIE